MLNEKHNRRFFFIPLFLLLLVFLIQAPAWADTTRTITLDANGGAFTEKAFIDNQLVEIKNQTKDVTFTIGDSGEEGDFSFINLGIIPIWENKEMVGWSVNKNATVPEYYGQSFQDINTYADNATYVPMDGSITKLYAVWADIYIITLDANGGDFGTNTDKYGNVTPITSLTEEFWSYGGNLCHNWIPDVVLRNSTKIHKGWSANKDAVRPDYYITLAGLALNSSTPKTLYAIWGEEGDRTSDYGYQPGTSGKGDSSSKTDDSSTAASSKTSSAEVPDSENIYTVGAFSYTVTNNTATVAAPKNKTATKVTIPATVRINGKSVPVTSIAPNAFKGMKKLTTVTIDKNIKTIGKNAFNGCKKLKKITIKTIKLTKKSIGANAFKGIHKKAVIKCPKAKKATYKKILLKKGMKKTMTFK